MRIWIVHQHAVPPITMGPTRHYDLAKKLIEQGHEVYIFASNYCHNTGKYIAEPYSVTQKIAYYGLVPFVWFHVPAFRTNSIKRFLNMLTFAYNLLTCKQLPYLPRPDLIIGSSPSPFAAYAAERIASKMKVPFVYEIRDLWPETLMTIGNFRPYHPLVLTFARIEKLLSRKAQRIIAVLPGIADYLNTKNLEDKKVIWVPNFCDLNNVITHDLPAQSTITILYAGAFNSGNDLETLLEAAKILEADYENKYQIVLLGDGPRKKHLQEVILKNNIKNVNFHFTLPKEQVPEFLAKADICVGMVKKSNLYRWGTSLNKITDYLASGRPVIFALDSPYNPITEAQAGLTVDPENPSALAAAIVKLSALPLEQRQQLGKNGREYALQNFNLDALAFKLIAELAPLASQGHE